MNGEVEQLTQQSGGLSCLPPTQTKVRPKSWVAACVGGTVFVTALVVGLAAAQPARAEVQMQVLYEFGLAPNPSFPACRLAEGSDGSFWGASTSGGSNGFGTVFKFSLSGTMTQVFAFAGTNGAWPYGGLVRGSDGSYYGATTSGGKDFSGSILSGYGTVFKITSNSLLTTLVFFESTNSGPQGPLAQAENGDFYGTTFYGGLFGYGSVFRITTNGTLTTVFSFNGTNGGYPNAGLLLGEDGVLYGTAQRGGSNFTGGFTGRGTVFRITTNGVLDTLVYFNWTNGAGPCAGLTKGGDGRLYGTTRGGGTGIGTVFSVTTNGTLTTLVSFDGTEGWGPYSGVTEGSDGAFYGVTANCCGTNVLTGYGTVFRVTTNGVLTTLEYLNGTNGMYPQSDMVLGSDGNLYGTLSDIFRNVAPDGNTGLIFRLVRQPVVAAQTSENGYVALFWSSFTNGLYRVECKSSLVATNWATLVTDVLSGGSTTTITDMVSGAAERYFRVVVLP